MKRKRSREYRYALHSTYDEREKRPRLTVDSTAGSMSGSIVESMKPKQRFQDMKKSAKLRQEIGRESRDKIVAAAIRSRGAMIDSDEKENRDLSRRGRDSEEKDCRASSRCRHSAIITSWKRTLIVCICPVLSPFVSAFGSLVRRVRVVLFNLQECSSWKRENRDPSKSTNNLTMGGRDWHCKKFRFQPRM